MKFTLYQIIEETLKTSSKYNSEDNRVLKAKVYDDVMRMDQDLLQLLVSNDLIKSTFFKTISGILVFDKQKFAWFLESKEFLPDSYTRYTNRIGLTHNQNFISSSNDVVLDFPYKDCVIEGGQSQDDQKYKEVCYNEIIASDEISRMFAPKVLGNAVKYYKDRVEENVIFNSKENLIIKGNNLIALATLLKIYEGKIKCIYIDPPYNTGSDSFGYNDSFNHSTWLMFMRNRLDLAKRLLTDDGLIFISCDDNEQAYLKVLCDELFKRENFVGDFIRKTKSTTNDAKTGLNYQHEFLLCFAKNKEKINLLGGEKDTSSYKNPDNDPNGPWISDNPSAKSGSDNYKFSITNPYTNATDDPPPGMYWRFSKDRLQEFVNNGKIKFRREHQENQRGFIFKRYLNELKTLKKTFNSLEFVDNMYMNQVGTKEAKALGFVEDFRYPKPEALIKKIIEHATEPGDIILDYHLGSGTTAAVAHKMGRQYIGIEQMDYIQSITIERMKKVLNGEQGGISEEVNWTGGGSFVYCELLEDNLKLIKLVQEADEDNINKIKDLIYNDIRIVPFISKENLMQNDESFNQLSLKEKKQTLIKLLDKNKLYVNYSDIDEVNKDIGLADKAFTDSFYKEI